MSTPPFRHVDHERTIVFGAGALDAASDLLGEGFTLLTTARAARAAPALVAGAGARVDVPGGLVEEIAGDLRDEVRGDRLLALGGGRVIDVAKALAAADPPRRVLAIPTTLSGAEMTRSHRHARGVDPATAHVRPDVVVNDPRLSASHDVADLAASSANALAHTLVAMVCDDVSPMAAAVALGAARRIAGAWVPDEPDRDVLALGALLAGWAIDVARIGLHHALAQTAVRVTGTGHAPSNAALLPHTAAAMRRRRPEAMARIDADLGVRFETLAAALRDRADISGLGDLDSDPALMERAVEMASQRAELRRVPPAPDADELRGIYQAAAG